LTKDIYSKYKHHFIGGKMIKQTYTTILFTFIIFHAFASGNNTNEQADNVSSAMKNSLVFNYSKVAGDKDLIHEDNFSEDFNLPMLRSSWFTESDHSTWTLKERPGYLKLNSTLLKEGENITENSFSKRIENKASGEAVTNIDLSALQDGDKSGIYIEGTENHAIQAQIINGEMHLLANVNGQCFGNIKIESTSVMFRARIEITKAWFEYSTDGSNFEKIGKTFSLNAVNNKQNKVGIFCINNATEGGASYFEWFYFNQNINTSVQFAELIR
jgi:beta-xylosidase